MDVTSAALTVPEGLALLLLRDADGRRAVELRTFHGVLAAGVLAELMALGAAELDDEGRVAVPAPAPGAPELIERTAARIVASPILQPAEWWIGRLARGSLTDAVIGGLVDRGIVEKTERAFLWFAGEPVYPACRSDEEEALREAIRWSLAVDHEAEPRVRATVALLDVVGRLREAAGFIPDGTVDVRAGQWPAAALQTWLLSHDPIARRRLQAAVQGSA